MKRIAGAASKTVYGGDDDILIHPEKHLGDIEKYKPFAVFTGTGYVATVQQGHDCGCPYCTHGYDEEDYFFQKESDMKRELKAYFDDDEVSEVREVFYAKAVKQCISDIFESVLKEATE